MTRMPEVPVLMMMRAQRKNLKISFSVEVSARLRVERPKSGLPLDLGLKRRMDGRVRYHNLIEYNFIHIRVIQYYFIHIRIKRQRIGMA
jgi:hypothetical protein